MGMNNSQKEKQKTTARKKRLFFVVLTSSLLVLSSIAAAAALLPINNNNSAFAAINCDLTDDGQTLEQECTGGAKLDDPNVSGGGGGRSTCTTDLSTFDQTCTSSGGVGANTEDFSGWRRKSDNKRF
jgi:hypothetical protein